MYLDESGCQLPPPFLSHFFLFPFFILPPFILCHLRPFVSVWFHLSSLLLTPPLGSGHAQYLAADDRQAAGGSVTEVIC